MSAGFEAWNGGYMQQRKTLPTMHRGCGQYTRYVAFKLLECL